MFRRGVSNDDEVSIIIYIWVRAFYVAQYSSLVLTMDGVGSIYIHKYSGLNCIMLYLFNVPCTSPLVSFSPRSPHSCVSDGAHCALYSAHRAPRVLYRWEFFRARTHEIACAIIAIQIYILI